MIEKKLSPLSDRPCYSDIIFKQIRYELYKSIFKPLFDILDIKKEIRNSKADLMNALASGQVQYRDGYFTGKFNANVSRELHKLGASFDKTRKAFKLNVQNIPSDIMSAIASGDAMLMDKLNRVKMKLDSLSTKKMDELHLGEHVQAIIIDLNIRSKKSLPSDMEVPMQMSPYVAQQIAEDYQKNLNLSIQGWYDDAILRLRSRVQENVEVGFRADKLAEQIKREYGVTEHKAEFLAKQETSLLVSKYRKSRYTECGIDEYIWSSSNDGRVRDDHAKLNGRKFRFDNPPVVDAATGRKANPGEDWGCRCVAIPVLTVSGVSK